MAPTETTEYLRVRKNSPSAGGSFGIRPRALRKVLLGGHQDNINAEYNVYTLYLFLGSLVSLFFLLGTYPAWGGIKVFGHLPAILHKRMQRPPHSFLPLFPIVFALALRLPQTSRTILSRNTTLTAINAIEALFWFSIAQPRDSPCPSARSEQQSPASPPIDFPSALARLGLSPLPLRARSPVPALDRAI